MRRTTAIAAAASVIAFTAAADVRISPEDGANHGYPAACRQPAGFVATWESDGEDGREVTVQRLDENGRALEARFRANQENTGDQQLPDIACRADGSFLVVWESRGQDGDGLGIFARDFAADGTPRGDELPVNEFTADHQTAPRVAACDDGSTVVVWQSFEQDGDGDGVYYRRFDSQAAPTSDEIAANETTIGNQSEADIACGSAGPIIVWKNRDAFDDRLVAILPDEGDGEFDLTPGSFAGARHPAVTTLSNEAFAVAFELTDSSDVAVTVGGFPPTAISTVTADASRRSEAPAVAAAADGRMLLAWASGSVFDFDLEGLRIGAELASNRRAALAANRTGNDGPQSPSGRGIDIATAPDGDLVIWQQRDVTATDSSSAIYTRRFRDCIGDCSDDGLVAINELITGVRIALHESTVDTCARFDANGSGVIEINELVRAVTEALARICPAPVT